MGKSKFTSPIENTPEGVVAWPVVYEPEIKTDQKTGKKREIYRCDLIIDATPENEVILDRLRAIGRLTAEAQWGDESQWPEFKTRLIRETSERKPNPQTGKPWEGYEPGKYFISCQSQYKPPIIDTAGREIVDARKFYGGCRAIFAVNAYTYEYMGFGVKLGLISIIKMDEGKPFGAARPDPGQLFKQLLKPGATPGGAVASPAGAEPRRRMI